MPASMYLERVSELENVWMEHCCEYITLCLDILAMVPLHYLLLLHDFHSIDDASILFAYLENLRAVMGVASACRPNAG